MRTMYIMFVLLCQCFVLYGQSRLGVALPDSSIVSLTSRSGRLYCGIDNLLKVNIDDFKTKDSVFLQANNGIVINDYPFIVIPERPGSLRITVMSTDGKTQRNLGFINFAVDNLPEPKLLIDTIIVTDNIALPREHLIKAKQLSIFISNDIIDSYKWYTIKEFSMGYYLGGYNISQNNTGCAFNEAMHKIIMGVLPDRYFIITVIIESNTGIIKTWPIARKIYVIDLP